VAAALKIQETLLVQPGVLELWVLQDKDMMEPQALTHMVAAAAVIVLLVAQHLAAALEHTLHYQVQM
jgi:hypothetical protein